MRQPTEWSPRKSYSAGDLVTLDGRAYEAVEANERVAPDSPKSRDHGTWVEVAANSEWANAT